MVLIDFHCHFYTDDAGAAMDKIIKEIVSQDNSCPEAISVGMILNNIREKNLWKNGAEFSLSKNSNNFTVIPFAGIHPWDSAETDQETIERLEETSAQTGAFIGEIGLDKLKGADKEKQLWVFRSCLEIALKSEKPFTLHCVRAWGVLIEELRKVKSRIKAPFIVHAYNSSAEVMKEIIALNGYPSFGLERYGVFSHNATDSISKIKLKYLLLETDFTCFLPKDAGANSECQNSINAGLRHGRRNDMEVASAIVQSTRKASAVLREDNYYGRKYIKRLLDVYNKAASVLKIDIAELSGVIEENGKVFKAYAANRK
ncbi:MAG: TatD family hydrolase [Spirochaetes bacterium]|nr:TatD family hydrolase [Spirochaetota bacterium]